MVLKAEKVPPSWVESTRPCCLPGTRRSSLWGRRRTAVPSQGIEDRVDSTPRVAQNPKAKAAISSLAVSWRSSQPPGHASRLVFVAQEDPSLAWQLSQLGRGQLGSYKVAPWLYPCCVHHLPLWRRLESKDFSNQPFCQNGLQGGPPAANQVGSNIREGDASLG